MGLTQKMPMVAMSVPYKDTAYWKTAIDAVEQITGPALVPDKLPLDFRNSKKALVTPFPKGFDGLFAD